MAIVENTQFGRVGAFRFWCQKVLPAVYDDSLSYYELLCKVTKWLQDLTDVTNTQSDAIEELQQTLQNFLDGEITPYIESVIDQWFIDNQPQIESDISDLQSRVGTLEGTAITLNNKIMSNSLKYNGTNLVFFGDSYSAPNISNSIDAYLPKRIATTLGCTLFNFAIAGAGWARESNNITTQMTNASGMSATEKANTSIVIAYLGCNDMLNYGNDNISNATIVSAIANFITWANTTYPNAEIYIVPFNYGFAKITMMMQYCITNVMNSIFAFSKIVNIIPYAWYWNLGLVTRFQNEMHPNQTGYNIICGHILNAIGKGCNNCFNSAMIFHYNTEYLNPDSEQNIFIAQNGTVNYRGFIRPTSSATRGQQLVIAQPGEIMPILTPHESFFVFPLTSTTTGEHAGEIYINNHGAASMRILSGIADNEVCVFNGTYHCEVGVDWSDYV